jgi:hypothetical protein
MYIEKNVSKSIMAMLNLLVMAVFIPIMLYAVYQTFTLMGYADEPKINISVNAIPVKDAKPAPANNNVKITSNGSKNRIIAMMNEISGIRLESQGETDSVRVFAVINGNSYKILITNSNLPGKSALVIPVTLNNLTPGKFQSRVIYAVESSCSINDPPISSPPKTISIFGTAIDTNVCLTSGNAVMWQVSKI